MSLPHQAASSSPSYCSIFLTGPPSSRPSFSICLWYCQSSLCNTKMRCSYSISVRSPHHCLTPPQRTPVPSQETPAGCSENSSGRGGLLNSASAFPEGLFPSALLTKDTRATPNYITATRNCITATPKCITATRNSLVLQMPCSSQLDFMVQLVLKWPSFLTYLLKPALSQPFPTRQTWLISRKSAPTGSVVLTTLHRNQLELRVFLPS